MSKHVLIVGGGVIGLSTAWYAARRGHRVTVIERGPADHDGCSFGNCGLVSPSHIVPLAAPGMVAAGLKWMLSPESPFYIRPRPSRDLLDWGWKFSRAATADRVAVAAPLLAELLLASRTEYLHLAEHAGDDFGLEQRGVLMLCKTEHRLAEEAEVAVQARPLGMAAEVLTAAQTAALDPGIRLDIAGSVYFPDDCHLTPTRLMASLTRLLVEAGVEIRWDTEVTGWRIEGGSKDQDGSYANSSGTRIDAVRTSRGDLEADEYVVCGGAWSPAVLRVLGIRLPMMAGKGYSLTLPDPPRLPRIPAICTEARVAVTPMGNALRFGGTMEIVGLDESINPARIRGIIKAAPRYYPDFSANDFKGIQPWRGLRPCSPDGLPYIGRFARFANLSVAAGHAMLGVSLGAITGKLMAELLSGESPSIASELLAPDRYGADG